MERKHSRCVSNDFTCPSIAYPRSLGAYLPRCTRFFFFFRRMADSRPRPLVLREGRRAAVRKLWPGFDRYVQCTLRHTPLITNSRLQQEYMYGSLVTRTSFSRANSKLKSNSINHSDLSIIFTQPQNVSALLGLSPKLPTLKTIVALGEIPEAARTLADAWGKERGVRVLTLKEREFVLFSRLCVSYY